MKFQQIRNGRQKVISIKKQTRMHKPIYDRNSNQIFQVFMIAM